MNAAPKTLKEFFMDPQIQLQVPVYQRPYSWQRDNCEQLLNDLEDLQNPKNAHVKHFFGPIVGVEDKDNPSKIIVVDGQQRITTVLLLCLAIINTTEATNKKLLNSYVFNENNGEKRIKLKLIKGDDTVFSEICRNSDNLNDKSLLAANYKYFESELMKRTATEVTALADCIGRLEIIDIRLNPERDQSAQTVFESLNAKGLDLSESEKICNFILMDLGYETQERLHETYWKKIVNNTKGPQSNIDDFLNSLLDFYFNTRMNTGIYNNFKKFAKTEYFNSLDNVLESEKLLKYLLEYSVEYYRIMHQCFASPQKNRCLKNIVIDLKQQTRVIPFLFMLYELGLDDFEYIETLKLMESYIIRRQIVIGAVDGIGNVLFIKNKIKKLKQEYPNVSYGTIIRYILVSDSKQSNLITDTAFERAFVQNQNLRNAEYVLKRIEEHQNPGINLSVYDRIEHIMPEKLTNEWINDLGFGAQAVHNLYLNNIGNLSLIEKQDVKSRAKLSFKAKCACFANSDLWLDKEFCNMNSFSGREIQNRAKMLFQVAKQVWPYYQPPVDILPVPDQEFITLNTPWQGNRKTKPYRVEIATQQIQFNADVKDWRACFPVLVKEIYRNYTTDIRNFLSFRNVFKSFLYDENAVIVDSRPKWMDTNDGKHRIEIDNGIFLHTHLNSKNMLDYLRILTQRLNISWNDVKIYL